MERLSEMFMHMELLGHTGKLSAIVKILTNLTHLLSKLF